MISNRLAYSLTFVFASLCIALQATGYQNEPSITAYDWENEQILIVKAEKNDELLAYSRELETWDSIPIHQKEKEVEKPIFRDNVALVILGDSLAAFSAKKGWWDVLPLKANSPMESLNLRSDLLLVRNAGHQYSFSATTGRWTSPTDLEFKEERYSKEVDNLPVSRDEIDKWFSSLPKYKSRTITVTNSQRTTVTAGRASWLEETCLKLQELSQLSYLLRIGDELRISSTTDGSLNLGDLNKGIAIQPDGNLQFPLLGQLKVEGQTIPQLRAKLNEEYKKFIKEPSVDVYLVKSSSSRPKLEASPQPKTESLEKTRRMESQSLIISLSKEGDELRGFSHKLGTWEKLKIAKQDKFMPHVGNSVGVVRIGDAMAAFSSEKGWWDVIPISKDFDSKPVVDADLIQVFDRDCHYTFSAASGTWTSPDDPDLDETQLPISISMSNEQWESTVRWMESLPPYKSRGIEVRPDGRTLLVKRKSWLPEIQAFLEKLESESQPPSSPYHVALSTGASPDARVSRIAKLVFRDTESFPDVEMAIKVMTNELSENSSELEPRFEGWIARLTTESQQAEKTATEFAAQIHRKAKTDDEDTANKLRELVQLAFDAKYRLQSAELIRSKMKLAVVEENLAERLKRKDRIVTKRVDALMDPQRETTEWNGSSP